MDQSTPAPARDDDDAALIGRVRGRVLAAIREEMSRAHVTVRAAEGAWEQVAPGVRRKVLHVTDGAVSTLVRLDPGTTVPGHLHPIDEECVVLEGTLKIGSKLLLRPGDFHVGRRGVPHEDASTDTGVLVFLRGAPPEALPAG